MLPSPTPKPASSCPNIEHLFSKFENKTAAKALAAVAGLVTVAFLLMELSAEDEFESSTWNGFWVPLIMSFFAGLSTTIGGLVIFLMGESPSNLSMALVLGLAAGVMIAVCIFDFWLPAVRTAWIDRDPTELLTRSVWTGVGVILFIGLSRFLDAHGHSQEEIAQKAAGGVVVASEGDAEEGNDVEASASTVYRDASESDSEASVATAVSSGSELSRVSHRSAAEREEIAAQKWRLALLMMITLTAHNFPEGAAVAFSALESRRLG